MVNNNYFVTDNLNNISSSKVCARDLLNPVIEGFDGVRKNNARQIFGILLIIIVVDFAMELIV